MAQHVGHLLEGGAACQQPIRHRVAKQMSTRVGQSGARVGLAYRLADEIRTHGLVTRREVAHEDCAVAGLGASVLQVSSDGRTGGGRQRQHIFPASLGVAQCDSASSPVDVIEAEPGDLTTAKPEIKSAPYDGGTTPLGAVGLTERFDQPLDFFRRQGLGQRGQLPVSRVGQRANEAVYDVAKGSPVAEVPAQRRTTVPALAGLL